MGEVALLLGIGLLFGALAPYHTDGMPEARRYLYWVCCIVGGGLIGVAIDLALRSRIPHTWLRVLAASLAMTPLVTLWVMGTALVVAGKPLQPGLWMSLPWQVFIVCAPILSVRALLWRTPVVRTPVVTAPLVPDAQGAFRQRLSARRRSAALIAVEAHDHYLRIHTDAGQELLSARFADALGELAGAQGLRVHRSWWVSADAIRRVRWRRGAGELELADGLLVPVSRTYAQALKAMGWR